MAPYVCSSDGQSNKEQYVHICSNEQSNTTCTRNTGDKNCQADKDTHMQPVQPAMKNNDMESVTSSSNRKSIEQSSSKQKNPRIQQYM